MAEMIYRISGDYEDIAMIHDALYNYNLDKCGGKREDIHAKRRPGQLAITISSSESGKFCGGMAFHPEQPAGKVFIDFLFVDDSLRGSGTGTALWHYFERWAKNNGISEIELTTNTFQAPGFYLKQGFKVVEEFPMPQQLVPENKKFRMRKTLL